MWHKIFLVLSLYDGVDSCSDRVYLTSNFVRGRYYHSFGKQVNIVFQKIIIFNTFEVKMAREKPNKAL